MNENKRNLLFDILIYSMSETEFNKRWIKEKEKMFNSFKSYNHTDESANEYIKKLCNPYDKWKYNQIIGFISVSISKNDICFELYYTLDKKIRYNSKTKHFIVNSYLNGYHFKINKNINNDQIKEQIFSWINSIKVEILKNRFYIDDEAFKNVIDFIDIKKMWNSI